MEELCEGSPEKQNQLDVWMDRWIDRLDRQIDNKELVHAVREADKPQDRSSASWRPRRASEGVPL